MPMESTGIEGLDDVLSGGLASGHIYLLEGSPGTGKTTIALTFLLAGAAQGKSGLYITLSETEAELRTGAASHGWTIGGKSIFLNWCRRMPRMNGAELALQVMEMRRGMPILVASGYAELPSGKEINLPRIAKPFHQDQLAVQLQKLLAGQGD